MYSSSEGIYFERVRAKLFFRRSIEWRFESSINSADCCEFDMKNRSIALEDIIRGPTCSDCLLLLQCLISGSKCIKMRVILYSSSSTVV